MNLFIITVINRMFFMVSMHYIIDIWARDTIG